MIFWRPVAFILLLFFVATFSTAIGEDSSPSLKINIICYRNGVGLNQDIDILTEELKNLGHDVQCVHFNDYTHKSKADVNVFVDVHEPYFLSLAEQNYYIPNPEWCFLSPDQLALYDKILCKTHETERIFKQFNRNSVYISFTSKDRYNPSISKNYRQPLHVAGASIQKGTHVLTDTWLRNPQFPLLILIRHDSKNQATFYPSAPNLNVVNEYLSDNVLKLLQNSCGLHVCPSESEGFGHYLMEALSCGSVVITTDAPPMNEFISDPRCLVKYYRTGPMRLATNFYADPELLDLKISNILGLSESELQEIGKRNREFYLQNKRLFQQKLAELFQKDPEKRAWGTTDFLWNLGIASQCDVGLNKDPFKFFLSYYDNTLKFTENDLKKGDIVWLRCKQVGQFNKLLPKIKVPIVLVISDGDESFPSACAREIDVEQLIGNENIIRIFAQNCDYKGPSKKVSHLPIGMDFHTAAYRGKFCGETGTPEEQEKQLKEICKELQSTHLRKNKAYVEFHLADSIRDGDCKRYLEVGEDRTTIFNRLINTGLIDYATSHIKRSDLWKIKGRYAFSISPHGNGLDCHRTWEDLALGCIVIVKTSTLDPLYEGLPVVIVKDWSEVTKENMALWLEQYKDAFTNPSYRERLTHNYWMAKIRRAADEQRLKQEKK